MSVPSDTISSGFNTKTTVGIMFVGSTIDNMVIGGPAYNCQRLNKGDILCKVDDEPVDVHTLHDKLIGSDIPGSLVKITVRSPTQNKEKEVVLTRMATTMIADNVRMFELFTSLKVCRSNDLCVCPQTPSTGVDMHKCTRNSFLNTCMDEHSHPDIHRSMIYCSHPYMRAYIDVCSLFVVVCVRCAGPGFQGEERLHRLACRRFYRVVESHASVGGRLQSQRLSCSPTLSTDVCPRLRRLFLAFNLCEESVTLLLCLTSLGFGSLRRF